MNVEELKERGAIEVSSETARGFQDDVLTAELDPALEQELKEIEDRVRNARRSTGEFAEKHSQALEENIESVKAFRFEGQDDLTDFVPGRMMGVGLFLEKFRRICPSAFYNEVPLAGRMGLNCLKDGKKVYITSIQFGVSPEFSQLRLDHHRLPTNERYRGWRTVLMTAIQKKIVTEEQVAREFGPPQGTPARNNRWYRDLYRLRNARD